MRKFFFILLAVFCSLNTQADDGDKFVGLWQMVFVQNTNVVALTPLKQYTKDGRFTLLIRVEGANDIFVTNEGTYEMGKKGTFTETLGENSLENAGKKSNLEYKFSEDGNWMYLKYAIEGTQAKGEEVWRRVGYLPKKYLSPQPQRGEASKRPLSL